MQVQYTLDDGTEVTDTVPDGSPLPTRHPRRLRHDGDAVCSKCGGVHPHRFVISTFRGRWCPDCFEAHHAKLVKSADAIELVGDDDGAFTVTPAAMAYVMVCTMGVYAFGGLVAAVTAFVVGNGAAILLAADLRVRNERRVRRAASVSGSPVATLPTTTQTIPVPATLPPRPPNPQIEQTRRRVSDEPVPAARPLREVKQ